MLGPPRLVLITSIVVAACGGAAGPTQPPPGASDGPPGARPTLGPPPIDVSAAPARVHADAGSATSSWVGPTGGTLTTTATDGTTYRLDLPEGAVPTATAITMAPVSGVDELGLSGGIAGAVYLQPAGLRLAVAATLTIQTGRSAPDGTRLAGFDVSDDGAVVDLVPAVAADGRIELPIFHFSSPGAAFGTTADLQRFSGAASGSLGAVMTKLLAFDVPWDATDLASARFELITAWGSVMEPALRLAADDGALLRAIGDWRQFVFLLNLFERRGDAALAVADGITYAGEFRDAMLVLFHEAGLSLVGQQVLRAVEGNKAVCAASHDLVALANTWFWARIGLRYHSAYTDWLAAAGGCAQIALPVANLPTNLVAGGGDSLNLQFVIEFSDGTPSVAEFEVSLTGNGFTFRNGLDALVTFQPGQASLTEQVTATREPPYGLTASACWFRDGIAQGLCSSPSAFMFGEGAATAPPPTAAGTAGTVPDVGGTYNLIVTCNGLTYGVSSATLTQAGDQVSMSWTITLTPDREQAVRDQLCWAPFLRGQLPTSGAFSGTIAQGEREINITLSGVSADPCGRVDPVPPTVIRYGLSWDIPASYCVPPGTPVRYSVNRQ